MLSRKQNWHARIEELQRQAIAAGSGAAGGTRACCAVQRCARRQNASAVRCSLVTVASVRCRLHMRRLRLKIRWLSAIRRLRLLPFARRRYIRRMRGARVTKELADETPSSYSQGKHACRSTQVCSSPKGPNWQNMGKVTMVGLGRVACVSRNKRAKRVVEGGQPGRCMRLRWWVTGGRRQFRYTKKVNGLEKK